MFTAPRLRTALLIGLWALSVGSPARADGPVGELDLKAAYVFNFIQFIEWPPSEAAGGGEWTLCVSPFSPLKRPLIALEGKPARKGQPIRVKLLQMTELRTCQVVVLHASDGEAVTSALRSLPPNNGILTIAEGPTTAGAGAGAGAGADAMITLLQQDGRVVFGIRADMASRAGLSVSSRLLRLARTGP